MDKTDILKRIEEELKKDALPTIEQVMAVAVPIWETLGVTEEFYMQEMQERAAQQQEDHLQLAQDNHAKQPPDRSDLPREQDQA